MKWVVRTSALRVSDAEGDRVYRSVEEAPEELRERIHTAFAGSNSQTILIANQEAYDHIASRPDDDPTPLADRLRQSLGKPRSPWHGPSRRRRDRIAAETDQSWRWLLGAGLATIAGLWALWIWAIRSGMS